MDSFAAIRDAAIRLRAEVPDADALSALSFVEKATERAGLSINPLAPDDPQLAGAFGLLNRTFGVVLVRDDLEPGVRAEVIAHEIGHAQVHDDPDTTVRQNYSDAAASDPVQRLDAYGAKERREAQANVFARELLLPRTLARRLFRDGMRARAIARQYQLPLPTVFQQLADGLLLPDPAPEPDKGAPKPRSPDPSQCAAAGHRGVAFLLEAGPGTGKTSTLVERIVGLVEQDKVPASQILALTFSKKAAGELTARIRSRIGPAAANVWAGTFHAFGYDLLRKHHERLGRGQDPRLVDPSEAVHFLEETLPSLPIVHYQNLFEPALALRDILRAISRAKDELVDAARYAELASAMERAAETEEAVLAAEKAGEVALVYEHYERKLHSIGAVDYGDLIMLPTQRLIDDEEFRGVLRAQFPFVHVDEYQDINRASALLVKGIVGDGDNLWVVGDARQSIYRFRGASAKNMARFTQDYPKSERGRLRVNYRSGKRIVETFVDFGKQMRVADYALPLDLDADRGDVGSTPASHAAADDDAEMDALAGRIEQLAGSGLRRCDQVVLARSNGTLARVAEELCARGLPVLYLGPLFSRPEVSDLIALLSLLVDPAGSGLVRVGGFEDYGVPLEDSLALIGHAQDTETRVIELLGRIEAIPSLSAHARLGLGKLAAHLEGFGPGNTPWLVLMDYLFERSDYLASLLNGQTPEDAMRRVAVRQLLDAVRKMPLSGSPSPISRALGRIRHMVLLSDDRELRQLPAELEGLDGVRLMTIHASKGLEFEAVHIPGVYAGAVPARNQGDRCPPPDGMITLEVESDAHEAEEECLLFVALSRAQSHLQLYRPKMRSGRTANASRFFDKPGLHLAEPAEVPRLTRKTPKPTFAPILQPPPPSRIRSADVELYDDCPRRFFYARVLGLGGHRVESTYRAAHQCLLTIIDYARDLTANQTFSASAARLRFDEAWRLSGLEGTLYEAAYRKLAEGMLDHLCGHLEGSPGSAYRLTLSLGGITVEVGADQSLADGGVTRLRTIRTGKVRTTDADRLGNTLILEAGRTHFGTAIVETFYARDATLLTVEQSAAKFANRMTRCQAIVDAMERGLYPPERSEWSCPRCPYFFICPAPASPA